MKNFKDLSIGDVFYKVYTDYRAEEKPIWIKMTVQTLQVSETNKVECLKVNQKSGYGSGYHYDFSFPIDKCNSHIVKDRDEGFFTTDYSTLVKLLSDAGLNYIREIERKIESEKRKIERVRVAYWDYLNNLVEEPVFVKA